MGTRSRFVLVYSGLGTGGGVLQLRTCTLYSSDSVTDVSSGLQAPFFIRRCALGSHVEQIRIQKGLDNRAHF